MALNSQAQQKPPCHIVWPVYVEKLEHENRAGGDTVVLISAPLHVGFQLLDPSTSPEDAFLQLLQQEDLVGSYHLVLSAG